MGNCNHHRIKLGRMHQGKIKVLLAGTFDIVHKGHLDMFRQAKELGDCLIVIVARDQNVRKLKGASPFHDENKRKAELEKIDIIDEIRQGSLGDPYKSIEEIKPEIICIGYDQGFFAEKLEDELRARKIDSKIIRLKAYKPHKYKSSKIKKSIGA
ncbi:MAG: adenylyltransferase/cytidyltransferase family protein [Nanoarchaeota archaeon]|nr:adenylyltransferase/cytidyltransferase family protein [Nanoarchaeota archaeon]